MEETQIWGKIDYLFRPPILDETRTQESFTNEGTEQVMKAAKIRDGLAGVIGRVQAEVGLEKTHILEAGETQRNEFAQRLKSDEGWKRGYTQILKLFGVENDPESLLPHINRPWWNSLQVNLSSDSYQEGVYSFRGPVSHSFLAQLKPTGIQVRNAITPGVQEKFQPLSVGVILHTSDGKIVLGYRGGANFSDTVHLMPVGSAEPHLERGAIWGSFDKESLEELNLPPLSYTSTELVAKTLEQMPAKSGWHYLVFRAKTDMTSDDVLYYWTTAVDRKEHKTLVAYSEEPGEMLDALRENLWDLSKADPTTLAKTTPANHGKFLPQCALGILSSYTQLYGKDFAREAEQVFGRHFDLTSCFER